jgi:hypothetical protein
MPDSTKEELSGLSSFEAKRRLHKNMVKIEPQKSILTTYLFSQKNFGHLSNG